MIKIKDLAKRSYAGDGRREHAPLEGAQEKPEPYVAPPRLRDAVNMALFLRRPLLIEGEAGTGKSRLAYAVAYELGYPLKEIYVKSTSQANDLLYTFDAIGRLYALQEHAAMAKLKEEKAIEFDAEGHPLQKKKFFKYGPLGEAIGLSKRNTPSVVLIDEIDKADDDFPNDLLLELDRLRFIPAEDPSMGIDALEKGSREKRRHFLPLVIITSNRSKELPRPFLRRCLFYYIPFPSREELQRIVEAHFGGRWTSMFEAALAQFWKLRNHTDWRKKPGTSEFLDWVRMVDEDRKKKRLTTRQLKECPLDQLPHLGALLKTQADLNLLGAHPG